MNMDPNTTARFWNNVEMIPFHDCWEWSGATKSRGYGSLGVSSTRRSEGAHRISWMIHYGIIPKGLCVCHKCDNPGCVKPDHLFLGTYKDNMLDCSRKGRHHETKRTKCEKGHIFDNPSLKGTKRCSLCHREFLFNERWKRYDLKNKNMRANK